MIAKVYQLARQSDCTFVSFFAWVVRCSELSSLLLDCFVLIWKTLSVSKVQLSGARVEQRAQLPSTQSQPACRIPWKLPIQEHVSDFRGIIKFTSWTLREHASQQIKRVPLKWIRKDAGHPDQQFRQFYGQKFKIAGPESIDNLQI